MDLAQRTPFRLGVLEVMPPSCRVAWPEGRRVLQPRVMQVLVTLAQAHGEVVSRETLIADCWQGRLVGQDAITRVMVELRRLAQDLEGQGFSLETIPRVGYRLTAEGGAVASAGVAIPPPAVSRRGLIGAAAGAGAVLALGGAGYLGYRAWRGAHMADDPIVIAVLPFEDLSAGGGRDYLARGATSQVRDALSRMAGVRVIADISSASVAKAAGGPAEQARRLGAGLLLTGSVIQSGDQVRISLDLTDPSLAAQVWNQSVDGPASNLFGLLDAVSSAAIQALIGRIGPDRIRRLPPARVRNPQVFELVVQANALLEQSRTLRMRGQEAAGEDAAEQAKALIDRALAIDAQDVPARVALASLTRNGWTRELAAQALTPLQRAAAAADIVRQALVSDPNDPTALTALGDYYRRYELRWKEAETLFRRAIEANPSLVEARWSYGYELGVLGRGKESLVQGKEVFRLDPENLYRRVALARLLYTAGERSAALARYDIELAADPGNAFLVREIYMMHLAETNPARLDRLAAKVRDLWSGREIPAAVAALLPRIAAGAAALRGAPGALVAMTDADVAAYEAAKQAPATREGRASVDLPYIYAIEYAWSGQTAKALDQLEKAVAAGSLYWPATLPYGPTEFPKAMRDNPRYAALWARDPRLQEMVRSRREASRTGQLARPWVHGADWGG